MALAPNKYVSREGVHGIEMRFLIAQDNKPSQEQLDFQRDFRLVLHQAAQHLNARVEDSREKSLALTKLEEALLWAGKAIFA